MSTSLLLIIVLVLLIVATLPTWPYSQAWGFEAPSAIGVILLIFFVLVLLGKF